MPLNPEGVSPAGFDAERFYRRAAWLPIIVPALAYAVAGGLSLFDPKSWLRTIAQVSGFIFFAGLYAIVPYLFFCLLFWKFFKPQTPAGYRRAVYAAPIIIAVPFSIVFGIVTWFQVRGSVGSAMLFAAAAALIDGYLYVVIIEIAYSIARYPKRS